MLRYERSSLSINATNDITLAEKIVKVPEMAESISEGTLKQWSKSMIGKLHRFVLLSPVAMADA